MLSWMKRIIHFLAKQRITLLYCQEVAKIWDLKKNIVESVIFCRDVREK